MNSDDSDSRYESKCSLFLVEMTVHLARERKASMALRGMERRSGPSSGQRKSISTFFSQLGGRGRRRRERGERRG